MPVARHPAKLASAALVEPVLKFLRCRSPAAWAEAAVAQIDTLLLDHAALELRAAQQAQRLIARYGSARDRGAALDPGTRLRLLRKLSRLAREELRHYEQVVELIATRAIPYDTVSASRYARTLHGEIRRDEPQRCSDTLIVAAIIEARSCERFYSLLPSLENTEPRLARFYASLLRAEARHFDDYLALARDAAGDDCRDRIDALLALDAELMHAPDTQLRFHSGPPG